MYVIALLLPCNNRLKYPGLFTRGVFTHAGPTAKQLAETNFTMTFLGQGYSATAAAALPVDAESGSTTAAATTSATDTAAPDLSIVCRVSGPEPGYVATPFIYLAVTQTVLQERDTLPCATGGVFSPGAALWGSGILDRLRSAGVAFDVISSSDSSTAPAAAESSSA
jgi:short subunit dehydrogenase-like uncharacterized protein